MSRTLIRRIEVLEELRRESSGNPWSIILRELSESALQAMVDAAKAGEAGQMSSAEYKAELLAILKRDAPNEGTLQRWMELLGEA